MYNVLMLNYAPPRLGQTPKNGWDDARDIAVVIATGAGAAASAYHINGRKTPFENWMLGLSTLALSVISLSTLINDVLPKFRASSS